MRSLLSAILIVVACNHPNAPDRYRVSDLALSLIGECQEDSNVLCVVLISGKSEPGATIWTITGGFARAIPVSIVLPSGAFSAQSFMRFKGGVGAMRVCAGQREPTNNFSECEELKMN